jgi:lysophospholipase L1-like esterase
MTSLRHIPRRALMAVALGVSIFASLPAQAEILDACDPRIASLGRTDRTDPVRIRFNWPASGIAFSANGEVDVRLESSDPGFRIAVFIDGKREKDIECPHPAGSVRIPIPAGGGMHAVGLRLANENHHRPAKAGVLGVETVGGAAFGEAPVFPARRILFVGDSYTVGYGALAKAPPRPSAGLSDKMALDDCVLAYPGAVAQALDAGYAVVARSGYGVRGTITDGSGRESLRNHLREAVFGGEAPVNPADWRPDVVVVRLGANDFSASKKSDPPTPEQFATAWDELIGRLREDYPGARIELLVIAKGAREPWHALVKESAARLGCGFIETTVPQGELGLDWHLTLDGHTRVCKALLAAAKDQSWF